jgi:hypothetical protein
MPISIQQHASFSISGCRVLSGLLGKLYRVTSIFTQRRAAINSLSRNESGLWLLKQPVRKERIQNPGARMWNGALRPFSLEILVCAEHELQ